MKTRTGLIISALVTGLILSSIITQSQMLKEKTNEIEIIQSKNLRHTPLYQKHFFKQIISSPISAEQKLSHELNRILWHISSIIMNFDNIPPNPPEIIGPTSGKIKEEQKYTFILTDPDEDILFNLEIDWGDGTESVDCGCGKSWQNGTEVIVIHQWKDGGSYNVTARIQDSYGDWSQWSDPLIVSMPLQKENTIQHNEINTNEITKN